MGKFIVLILLIIFIFVVRIIFTPDENKGFMHEYNDIKKNLKTGDILLFSCFNNQLSAVWKLLYRFKINLIGSNISHAGMIVRCNNGAIYVLECCDHNQCAWEYAYHFNNYGKGGVRMVEFETLLKSYSKEYGGTYSVKFISEPIPNKVLADKLKNYKEVTFPDYKIISIMAVTDILISNSLARKITKECDKNKMICSEFLYNILKDCGVLKKYPSKLFWPHLVTSWIFRKLEKIKYSAPYEFEFK